MIMIDCLASSIEERCGHVISHRFAQELARIAVRTLREANHAMEDAGILALDESAGENNIKRVDLMTAWRAMCDEALK